MDVRCPTMAAPEEGSAHGDPSFTLPSLLLLECEEPSLWGWRKPAILALAFPILAPGSKERKPQDLHTQSQSQPIAPKKEELLGFPEEGDVTSEMSLRETTQ